MKVVTKIVSLLGIAMAIAFLLASILLIMNKQLREDEASLVYIGLSAGCSVNTYAIPILLIAFIILGIEIALRYKQVSGRAVIASGLSAWKTAILTDNVSSPLLRLFASLSRFMLVLLLISQLSYGFNHCENLSQGYQQTIAVLFIPSRSS